MYLNKAYIIGNLTRDPELRVMPNGGNVCNFSVATNRTWTDKGTGKKEESVEFHNIVAFGRTAETVAQYMRKGSQILVEGRIQTKSWEDKDKIRKYRTEIVAESVQFGSSPRGSIEKPAKPKYQGAPDEQEIDVKDIPF